MLRIGYMPSDFHPVLLVLGNHADLDRFSEILGQFSGDGRTREMGIDTDVYSTNTRVILAGPESGRRYGLWPDEADGSQLHWTLTKEDAGAFFREVVDLSSSGAPAGSTTLECDILDEIKVKVSIGEWEDHFLEDGGR